ncbi:uncharacterized protein LOC119573531 [Penaeus monodon]|uniref:uncharacterized protein LOC119573531 n=1 Tax=Penaeus monodon TaxID=6687 RepID=UPI0018A724F8|nr:uncharacterized protein LOC119573531 [Penaeus monodon]
MSHDLELLVEVPEGVGICRLTLRLRGQNLACVQGGDWYRGERFSWLNTSRLHYEPDEANVTRARLTFFGITSVGSQPITQNYNDQSDLLVNIPLLPPQGFSGGLVRATLREWEGEAWASANLSLPAATLAPEEPVPGGTNLTFSVSVVKQTT